MTASTNPASSSFRVRAACMGFVGIGPQFSVTCGRKLRDMTRLAARPDAARRLTVVRVLADIGTAASHVRDAVNRLASGELETPRQQAQCLLEVQTWLYQELEDHARNLKRPLQALIHSLYQHVPDELPQ